MKNMIKHAVCAALLGGLGLVSPPAPADNAKTLQTSDGEQVYQHVCQGCHMSEGQGAVGAGYYPAFAGNPNMASAQYMALTILTGRRNMPSFFEYDSSGDLFWFTRVALSDEQVANVVNYIRSHFGNAYEDRLTAADVKAMHP